MKGTAAVLALGAVLLISVSAWGREVVLGLGETFSEEDLTVRCVERSPPQIITLTECQYWDEFNQVCQYESTTYRYGELACVEECQHWDSFNDACFYATRCEFFPSQRAFVRTTCDVFDEIEHVCRRTKQELIKDGFR